MMDWYLSTSAGPYEVGKQAVALASLDLAFTALIATVAGVVFLAAFAVSRVRPKAEEKPATPDYSAVREAVYRASEQERVEEAARQQ